ncbi:hypothetical protein [Spiroplasma chinense]|uniref:hypothetical protein n=1 Tax=Spiroplasma chinense TaxID=216932 RepID=UPI001412C9D6|nr:hypothetical protein [Spiroplasma chinense]
MAKQYTKDEKLNILKECVDASITNVSVNLTWALRQLNVEEENLRKKEKVPLNEGEVQVQKVTKKNSKIKIEF